MKAQVFFIVPILTAHLAMSACAPVGPAPVIPEPVSGQDAGTADLETGAEDGDTKNTPTDASVESRLDSLPIFYSDAIKACEEDGFFYSIGDEICTTTKPAEFDCQIDETFYARIDESSWSDLKAYLTTKAKNLQLYSCTEDAELITLHFYNYREEVIYYKSLNIPKALAGVK